MSPAQVDNHSSEVEMHRKWSDLCWTPLSPPGNPLFVILPQCRSSTCTFQLAVACFCRVIKSWGKNAGAVVGVSGALGGCLPSTGLQCEIFHSWSLSYKCRLALASPGLHQEMGQGILPEGLHWVISVGSSLRGQCALGFVTLGKIHDLAEPQLPPL